MRELGALLVGFAIAVQDFCLLAPQEHLQITNHGELFMGRLVVVQGGGNGDRGRIAAQDSGPLEPQERLQVADQRELFLDRLVVTQCGGARTGQSQVVAVEV